MEKRRRKSFKSSFITIVRDLAPNWKMEVPKRWQGETPIRPRDTLNETELVPATDHFKRSIHRRTANQPNCVSVSPVQERNVNQKLRSAIVIRAFFEIVQCEPLRRDWHATCSAGVVLGLLLETNPTRHASVGMI